MNPYNILKSLPESTDEVFETLCQTESVLIERIVSRGQTTAENTWYDQERHEWVILLQGSATLLFDREGGEELPLTTGDYVHIPPHRLHRVIDTSIEPPCIWLAIHFN